MTARLLYSLAFGLAMPLVWLRLWWRARRQPEYLQHLGERHGSYAASPSTPLIWLHAVSVGETRAAEPLIAALLSDYPDHGLLLTHMTPTGRAAGAELLTKHPGRVTQAYLPYDLPFACRRFLAHFLPQIWLLIETELWPNLIEAARRRQLPIVLINARLSARSLRGYQQLRQLIAPAVAALSGLAAQTVADGERLQQLGAQAVEITGNLKFDVTPAPELLARGADWRQALGRRPVWLAASTREGEESLIVEAFAALPDNELLLVIVPRHPQRFAAVAKLLGERGLAYCRRSDGELPKRSHRVWLGDSMGEMAAYYALADLTLIGGTLLPYGGQNLIEAAACECPLILGPHTFNFAQASADALAAGAGRQVNDAMAAARLVETLLNETERRELRGMRLAAARFSQAHRGATERTMALIRRLMAFPAGR
ncbi:MAG: 3-deoxy-D-manno-octulosonic acid transferase [Elusimicrobia bacterium]|nr:MAG: 3-deoxy-D-manno-octulosonic acid transferase [Elusimicrobiota bacterium]